ncbi:MAG: hypothetical protein WCF19_03600 [Chlamydiales bacterium]
MKRAMRRLLTLVICGSEICADSTECTPPCWRALFEANWDLGFGCRQDTLRFVDSYKTQPLLGGNTLIRANDHQKWNGLNIVELEGFLSLAYKNFYVRGLADYGWIVGGENPATDSQTIMGGGITEALATYTSGRTQGYVWDGSGGVGYQLHWDRVHLMATPLIGYSYHKQKTNQPSIRGFSNQDIISVTSSTYSDTGNRKAIYKWYGPWVGLDLAYYPTCAFKIFGTYEFHWGWSSLFGKANVSLIQTSPPTTPPLTASVVAYRTYNDDRSTGNDASLGFSYKFCHWTVGLLGNYKYWKVNRGSNVNKYETLSIEPEPVIGKGSAEKINWQSWSLLATIGFDFILKKK